MVSISQAVRSAIEKFYTGTCDIIERQKVPDGNLTKFEEVTVQKNVPCRLSYRTYNNTNTDEGANEVSQVARLFLSPEIEIKAGSKIEVTQAGRTVAYKKSGQPAVYESHQEIGLELFDRWA